MIASAALETFLAIGPKSNEEQVLRLLIELGAQFVGASEGSLLVYDAHAKDLVFAMNVGGDEQLLIGQRVPIGKGLTGLAAVTREVQIGAPTFRGIKQAEVGEKIDDRAPESVIAAPMLIGDELVGVITAVTFEAGKRFTSAQGELYARLSAVAGVVVEQRQKLEVVGAMSAGREEPRDADESHPERVIAATIGRLSRNAPHVLGSVARILLELEAMTTGASR
jgi:GAF domain-containing protein